MLLSCSAKKVTKECGIGEALRLVAHLRAKSRTSSGYAPKRACGRSHTRAALPYVPTRRALFDLWSTLTGKTCYLVAALRKRTVPLWSALPLCAEMTLRAKVGTLLPEQDVG